MVSGFTFYYRATIASVAGTGIKTNIHTSGRASPQINVNEQWSVVFTGVLGPTCGKGQSFQQREQGTATRRRLRSDLYPIPHTKVQVD